MSKMQSESKLCYLNTAYSVIFQLENLSSQTSTLFYLVSDISDVLNILTIGFVPCSCQDYRYMCLGKQRGKYYRGKATSF